MTAWIMSFLSILVGTFAMLMFISTLEDILSWVVDRCIFKGHSWLELPAFYVCGRCEKLNFRMKDPGSVGANPRSRFKGDGHTPR